MIYPKVLSMRINRYLSLCGLASRRKCEEYILNSLITVNESICTNLSTVINPKKDKVYYNGNQLKPPLEQIYLILNKPRGYLTTAYDPFNRNTIYSLIKEINEKIFHVGRLDQDSEGLLLLTNDGKLSHRLQHPKYEVPKTYFITINSHISQQDILKLSTGIQLEEGITKPAKIQLLKSSSDDSQFYLTISQGWKRQIRRMLSSLNHNVIQLKRISIGSVNITGLETGNWRKLNLNEVKSLKRMVNLPQ